MIVPSGEVGALSDALAALVTDRDRRLGLGTAARVRVAAGGWSWDDYVERAYANYRTLIG